MKLNYYGYIGRSDIIREAKGRLFQMEAGLSDSDTQLELIKVQPNPIDVLGLADSDFGFTTTITQTFGDSS